MPMGNPVNSFSSVSLKSSDSSIVNPLRASASAIGPPTSVWAIVIGSTHALSSSSSSGSISLRYHQSEVLKLYSRTTDFAALTTLIKFRVGFFHKRVYSLRIEEAHIELSSTLTKGCARTPRHSRKNKSRAVQEAVRNCGQQPQSASYEPPRNQFLSLITTGRPLGCPVPRRRYRLMRSRLTQGLRFCGAHGEKGQSASEGELSSPRQVKTLHPNRPTSELQAVDYLSTCACAVAHRKGSRPPVRPWARPATVAPPTAVRGTVRQARVRPARLHLLTLTQEPWRGELLLGTYLSMLMI